MEGEMERVEIKHCNNHGCPLTLRENYHSEDDSVCHHCDEQILCKSSVYTCDKGCAFFLHKNCGDLPITFMHPKHPHILHLFSPLRYLYKRCAVCNKSVLAFSYVYNCDKCGFYLCVKCVRTPLQGTIFHHWSHPHRPLRFMKRRATIECDACNTVAAESSYRCDDSECSFWIHESCATLPLFKLFKIHHKHPLRISDSLPQLYGQFTQQCRICKKEMEKNRWLYYCGRCRFFAHISCALSNTPVLREVPDFDEEKLMHLPISHEETMNFMIQKLIKDTISLSVDITVAPPNYINHWAHTHHPLTLKNKSEFIINDQEELNQISEKLIICDGCTKPISFFDDADVFYQCSECYYSLHRYCAQFPQEVYQHDSLVLWKGLQPSGYHVNIQCCNNCSGCSNGFMFRQLHHDLKNAVWCIWCVCIPEKVIHKTHHHPLDKCFNSYYRNCEACKEKIGCYIALGCQRCNFFIHHDCALRPATIIDRWDPHPLRLVLSVEDDVEDDHPHDFECEYCSRVINTNGWFYHCNICDLSFHSDRYCLNDRYYKYSYQYSNIKFGAANIKIEDHEHTLALVRNKKKPMPCTTCGRNTKGSPILQCKSCKFIHHYYHM